LIDDTNRLKLADFGLATQVKTVVKNNINSTQLLTISYCAPERVNGLDYGEPYDLWAIGCTLYELSTGDKAFKRDLRKINSVDYDKEAMKDINPLFKELIEGVLVYQPQKRLTINQFCDKLDKVDMSNFSSLDIS